MSGSGTYDVTLNPGAQAPIIAAGGYCKVISAPAGQVQLKTDNGETWTVNEGQGFRMPDGEEFSRILVKNLATLAQTVLIVIGDALFEDTRIAGSVRIIDSSVDKTLALRQFFGSSSVTGGAATFGCAAVAALGGNVAFKRITLSSPTAQSIMIYRGDNVGTAIVGLGVIQNKKFPGSGGGNFASAQAGGGTCAAAVPTVAEIAGKVPYVSIDVPASSPIEVPMTSPFVITGSQVIAAVAQTANTKVTMVFDMEEWT